MDLEQRVAHQFASHIEAASDAGVRLAAPIARAAALIVQSLLSGGKVLSCGNGGSAAAAQHFMSKMVNRFERERPGLPAIAINAGFAMTSVADGMGCEQVFSRQVAALAHPGDTLLAISCSGESPNILHALETAHERQMHVIALTGCDGGRLAVSLREHDVEIRVPHASVPRIQEVQLLVIHCLCDLIDAQLLGNQESP